MKTYEQENLVPFYEKKQHYRDTRTVFTITSVLYVGLIIFAICCKEWHDLMYMINVLALLIYGAVANGELKQLCELAILNIKDVRVKADIDVLTSRYGWVPTADQLPPEDESTGVGSGLSIDCLVVAWEGESYCIVQAWYDYNGKCWNEKFDFDQTHIDGREVSHWTPVPKFEGFKE